MDHLWLHPLLPYVLSVFFFYILSLIKPCMAQTRGRPSSPFWQAMTVRDRPGWRTSSFRWSRLPFLGLHPVPRLLGVELALLPYSEWKNTMIRRTMMLLKRLVPNDDWNPEKLSLLKSGARAVCMCVREREILPMCVVFERLTYVLPKCIKVHSCTEKK